MLLLAFDKWVALLITVNIFIIYTITDFNSVEVKWCTDFENLSETAVITDEYFLGNEGFLSSHNCI